MEAACTSVSTLMLKGVQIGCAELLDVESMRVMNYALDQRFEEAPTILFKFSGTAGQVREAIHEAGEVCTNLGGHKFSFAGDKNASFLFSEDNKSTASFHSLSCGHHQMPPTPTTPTTSKQTIPKPTPATSPTPATPTSPTPTSPTATAIACSASELWSARKGLLWSIQAYRENADNSKQQYTTDETDSKWVPCVTDVCVPISKLAEAVVATKEDLQSQGMFFAPVFGHVGDGNYHVVIMFDANNAEHLQACKDVSHRMASRAIAMGGTCTGEHGIGIGKRELLEEMYPSSTVDVMRRIKASLDPNGIMNPNKVFFL
eukprot:GHVS01087869.1.p1 GENE.GHVS01087869.1~~GHVS01087869.1.p1  ORF type:complete len:317 (-),score=42.27 GHVS01087869.1:301-1251(-)